MAAKVADKRTSPLTTVPSGYRKRLRDLFCAANRACRNNSGRKRTKRKPGRLLRRSSPRVFVGSPRNISAVSRPTDRSGRPGNPGRSIERDNVVMKFIMSRDRHGRRSRLGVACGRFQQVSRLGRRN